jgi:tetratricopeptide (TPR) repeat protein
MTGAMSFANVGVEGRRKGSACAHAPSQVATRHTRTKPARFTALVYESTLPRAARATPASARSFVKLAFTVFCVALAVRLVHIWQLRSAPFFSVLIGDARGYDEWARRLAAGDWIGSEVFYQAPLYPYFLGVIYRTLGSDPLTVRVVQAIVGSLSCAAIAFAGYRLFSRGAGIVAGAALAVYPAAIFFDALIQKSVLDLFWTCVILALIGIIATGHEHRRAAWFGLGVAVGALSLTRENALLLAAVLFLWALQRGLTNFESRPAKNARDRVSPVLFVAGLALVLLPVASRNAAVGDGFYLTTSQFGSNFFIGNNPGSDGTYMSLRPGRGDPEFERTDATELAEQASGRPLTPAEVSDYWFTRALTFIRAEPAAWLRLMARKAALLVNTSEMLDTESQESHAEHSSILALASLVGRFGVLVPLALFGAVVIWPRRRELWVLYALTLTYAVSVVLFFVMARYRHPLLPFLLLFAAAGVTGAPGFFRSVPRRRIVAAAAAVFAAVVITNRPMLSTTLMRAISEHNLGAALQEQGRIDEAIVHYERALTLQPDYSPSYNNLGTARMAKGELAGAVSAFREALRLRPSPQARALVARAAYDMGSALAERGAFARAEPLFREALQLQPDYAEAHNNLGITLASMGKLEEAMGHWREALRIKPGFADAERNLALALSQK